MKSPFSPNGLMSKASALLTVVFLISTGTFIPSAGVTPVAPRIVQAPSPVNGWQLRFTTELNVSYETQVSADLVNWQTRAVVKAGARETSWDDALAATVGARFYRVGISNTAVTHGVQHHVYAGDSVQKVIDKAAAQDSVYLHAGTYHELVLLKQGVNLTGEDGATVILDGQGQYSAVILARGDNVIEGVTVTGGAADSGMPMSAILVEGSNVILRDSRVIDNADLGVYLYSGDNILIKNVLFKNNLVAIQHPSAAVTHAVIRYNTLDNNHTGINIRDGVTPRIEHNIITGSTYAAIYEFNWNAYVNEQPSRGFATVENNTFFSNAWQPTDYGSSTPPAVEDLTAGNMTADPQFNNPSNSDYSIPENSPAFGRGALIPDILKFALARADSVRERTGATYRIEEIRSGPLLTAWRFVYSDGSVETFDKDGTKHLDTTPPVIAIQSATTPTNQSAYELVYTIDGGVPQTQSYMLAEGPNDLTVYASDIFGNQTIQNINVILDTIAPVLVLDPATPSLIKVNTLTVNYTADGVAKQQSFTNLAEGANALAITATDPAGNSTTVSFSVTVDTITPALVIDPATPSLIKVNTLTVHYTADGVAKQQIFTNLAEGANALALTETDPAGNSTTVSFSVTVDTILVPDVGYWSLDGSDAGLTVSGATSVAGKVGQALHFNGAGVARVTYNSKMNTPRLSLAFWFKKDPSTQNESIVGRRYGSGYEDIWLLYYVRTSNKYHFILRTTNGTVDLVGPSPSGDWEHLAVTYDGSEIKLYVNGVKFTPQPPTAGACTGAIATAATDLYLGAGDNGSYGITENCRGTMDEVRIYGYDLTVAEVGALAGRAADTIPPTTPANLRVVTTPGTQLQPNLAWDASTDGGGIAGYYVYRSSAAGLPGVKIKMYRGDHGEIPMVTGTSYIDTSVTASDAGHPFYYSVQAVDTSGLVSAISNQIQVTPQNVSPILLSASGHYVQTTPGTPFFYLGDTEWALNKHNENDILTLLADRQAKGFTVIKIAATGDNYIYLHTRADQFSNDPFVGDVMHLNAGWWNYLSWIVDRLAERNLYVELTVGGPGRIEYDIYAQNNSQAYEYGRQVGNLFKDKKNIIFNIGQDAPAVSNPGDNPQNIGLTGWRAIAEGVADGVNGANNYNPGAASADYSTTFMTFHPGGLSPYTSSGWFNTSIDNWLDSNGIEVWGHSESIYPTVNSDYGLNPSAPKPTLMVEGTYEDGTGYSLSGLTTITPRYVRLEAWHTFFAGGAGYVYGNADNWRQTDNINYITSIGSGQMKVLTNFMTAREWWKFVPDQAMITLPGSGNTRVAAVRSTDGDEVYVEPVPKPRLFGATSRSVHTHTAKTVSYANM